MLTGFLFGWLLYEEHWVRAYNNEYINKYNTIEYIYKYSLPQSVICGWEAAESYFI
jgi:hypothetical protein